MHTIRKSLNTQAKGDTDTDKKRYEKAEIIIKQFSAEKVILASTAFVPEYTPGEDEIEIMPAP